MFRDNNYDQRFGFLLISELPLPHVNCFWSSFAVFWSSSDADLQCLTGFVALVIVRKGIAGIFVGSPTVPGNGAHVGFSSTRQLMQSLPMDTVMG